MARYEHLPIYKAALDLTVHLEKVVARFSRYHKYSLGTELREGSRGLLQQVLKANNAQGGMAELRGRIEALTLSMRVAKEVKAFRSFSGYLHAVEQVGSVARQIEGGFKPTQSKG